MHLLPQHFQLQSLRAETLSARLSESAQPWYWGVQSIDAQVSSGGKISIKALEVIFPDGLVADLDPAKDKDPQQYPLELTVTAQDFGDQSSLMVYLAVDPLWRSDQLLQTKGLNGRLRSITSEAVADLSSGEFPSPINVWRPNLRLVTAAGRSDSVCVPVLRLSVDGGVFSQASYVPPCPLVLPDSTIGKRVSDLCFLARSKCEFLSGRWRQAQEAGKALESAELRSQLVAIWSRLPELQATLDTAIARPAALYLQLVGFAGALASLQPELGVRDFRPLIFEDLLFGFDEVLDWLESCLNNIRAGYSRRNFDYQDKHFSIALVDRQSAQQRLVIGLRMPFGAPPHAAREWLEHAIICSRPQLPTLVRQRMHGLARQILERSDQVGYGVAEDVRLFSVLARGEWFLPDTDLCLFVPPGKDWVEPVEILIFDASKSD